jgi:hypothetical protein
MRLRTLSAILAAVGLSVVLAAPASASEAVVVSPNHMHGWFFFNDNTNGPGTGHMVSGPGHPPLGSGSAELTVGTPTDRQALGIQAYQGTMLKNITSLNYWTYQTSPTHAVTLQFDVKYTATNNAYQGRLVFEPGAGSGNPGIATAAWQRWDALSGKWWASRSAASGGLCIQASPCTWAQVKTNWPDASLWPQGNLLFKVGGPWELWTGNVDAFTIGVHGHGTKTFDFEPSCDEEGGGHGDNNCED